MFGVVFIVLFAVAAGVANIMWTHRHAKPITVALAIVMAAITAGVRCVLAEDSLGQPLIPAIAILLAYLAWTAFYCGLPEPLELAIELHPHQTRRYRRDDDGAFCKF